LDQAQKEANKKAHKNTEENKKNQNARFIILDPNGEYHRAFQDHKNARIFSVEATGKEKSLNVPLWFWNSFEWSAFTQASGKTQRPVLRKALRDIKSGRPLANTEDDENQKLEIRRYFSYQATLINGAIRTSQIKEDATKFGFYLKSILDDINSKFSADTELLDSLKKTIKKCCDIYYKTFMKDGRQIEYYNSFSENDVDSVLTDIMNILEKLGGIVYKEGPEEDCPLPFKGAVFADHIQQLSIQEKVSQYLDFLVMRIRTMLSDTRMKPILENKTEITLDKWLSSYIGDSSISDSTISIIDLSLVPTDIVHIVTAVISRMIFESLQRYRKLHEEHKSLPTVLVMEEAHNFIKRYKDDSENQTASAICCQVFERIAREGRKFGLGLVLSSQRPSELSPTVLSQCNTFILHRISNDRDQELVLKLVPDNLRGLLRDLPSLPSQNAILLGWAVELPLLVRMNSLPQDQQPQSEDPDFWDVWTGEQSREVNWKEIADDWQQISKTSSEDMGLESEPPHA
jgi:DNA helicase HerA-like ATPase